MLEDKPLQKITPTDLLKTIEEIYPKGELIPLAEALQKSELQAPGFRQALWQLREEGKVKLVSSHSGTAKKDSDKIFCEFGPRRTNYSYFELPVIQSKEAFITGFRSLLFQDYRRDPDRNLYTRVYREILKELPIRVIRRGEETIGYLHLASQGQELGLTPTAVYDLKGMRQAVFFKIWKDLCSTSGEDSLAEKKVVEIALKDGEGTVLYFVQSSMLLPDKTRSL